jgi:hypothetical protein
MARLTYYATKLPDKETWFQTPEGYRIYRNVPIARTGSQNYLGREIKKNPGYKPEWNVGDDDIVTVYRPLEEVTHPAAIASFEIKSVLDEHPPEPQVLIDAVDEYDGISKGSVCNVRVGDVMPDGETPLIADLWVKHPDLNLIIENGRRDVSCGYTFMLAKDEHDKFIMTEIRGNHVAVVPTGRAGRLYGIGDSALESRNRRTIMPNRLLIALGLQAALKDAKPDEASAIVDAAFKEAKGGKDEVESKAEAEREEKERKAKDCAANDDEAETEEEKKERLAKRKEAKDKKAKDAAEYGEDEMTDADKLEEDEKKDKKEEKKEAAEDADALILPADEHSKSEFSTGDAAKHLLTLKPVIAACKSKGVKDAYNALCKGVRQVKSGIKDGATDPFALLTRISSADGAADNEAEIPMFQFFNGKSHADGLKAYNEYMDRRAARARK